MSNRRTLSAYGWPTHRKRARARARELRRRERIRLLHRRNPTSDTSPTDWSTP